MMWETCRRDCMPDSRADFRDRGRKMFGARYCHVELRAALLATTTLVVAGSPALIWVGVPMLLPSVAAAQCVTDGLDQTCSNSVSITGPLNAAVTGDVFIGAGAPGVNGGNATVNNSLSARSRSMAGPKT
jgi:hypothetical protein